MANKLLSRVGKIFRPKPKTDFPLTRGIGGAVAIKDRNRSFGGYFNSVLNRAGLQRKLADFTEKALNNLTDDQVRDLIKRSNPIVAKALADYSDAVASMFTYTADRTVAEMPDSPAQRLLADFILRLEDKQADMDQLIAEAGRGMFAHGGVFMELIIDTDGRTPVTIKNLDPTTAAFRKRIDPLEGEVYELGQDIGYFAGMRVPVRRVERTVSFTGGVNFVSLDDDPTIQYRPIQSEANNPYGTPLLDPSVFYVIMWAGFFNSIDQAVLGNVWPAMQIGLDSELFKKSVAALGKTPEEVQKAFIASADAIKKEIANLKPGGALVTDDTVEIKGTLTGNSKAPLGGLKEVHDVMRREIVTAVQSQPVLMGSNEAISETHAVEQRKDYAKLIRRSQKALNAVFTRFFNLILQLNGHPPLARFQLSYHNSAEYKDQAATYLDFREGLLKGSEDMIKLVEALVAAKDAGLITEQEMMEEWQKARELRERVDILPSG